MVQSDLLLLEVGTCVIIFKGALDNSPTTLHLYSAVYRYTASELEQDRNTSTDISSSSSSSFVAETLKTIQGRMQRIAGKRIPMEKFVSRKSRKYADQGNYLILPAVEMLMIRNGYDLKCASKKFGCLTL